MEILGGIKSRLAHRRDRIKQRVRDTKSNIKSWRSRGAFAVATDQAKGFTDKNAQTRVEVRRDIGGE